MNSSSNSEQIASEAGIQSAYSDAKTAKQYVETRFTDELNSLLHDRQVAVINRAIAHAQPRRVLEIACGPGRLTRDIRPASQLSCLEFNTEMLRIARQACSPEISWVRGNAFQLPLADRFDMVYSFRFIRHFHRVDRDRLHAEIHRVLNPGGLLVFDTVNAVVSRPLREANPGAYKIYDKLYDSQQAVCDEMRAVGFTVESFEPVQRWLGPQYQAQVLLGPRNRWLCRTVIRTLERLRRGPALEWIVTCRRA